jgi:hypothetical protein
MEPPVNSDRSTSFEKPPVRSRAAQIHPLLFALVSLVLVFFLYQMIGGGITFLVLGGTIDQNNVTLVRWATVASQILFILIPTLILGRARFGSFAQGFRLRLPRPTELLVSIVAVFALQQVLQVYMLAQDALPMPEVIRKFVVML